MFRPVLAVLAVLAAAPWTAAQAGPEEPGPAGSTCAFHSVNEPGTTHFHGVVEGGPIFGNGTLTCTVQVDQPTHAGDDTFSASASNTTAVALNPTAFEYDVLPGQSVYLCSQWTPAGGTPLYYHAGDDTAGDGHWSSDPDSTCAVAFSSQEEQNDVFRQYVDPAVCVVTPFVLTGSVGGGLVVVDETGDVWVAGQQVWNCPPY